MCGITGWFNLQLLSEQRKPLLERMASSISHRGPDDRGLYIDDHAGLGFCRLSIVDLEGGHQPMGSDDGAIQIVFNGEVYNHNVLREELKNAGHHFKTSSDTEVLLRLYERYGVKAFERLNGMFAVAVWDKRNKVFHLVRDRLGVKPLYYSNVGGALVFGSEIKAILTSGYIAKRINERALWDYLTFRYVPAPETIWHGIMKLPPAHMLTMKIDDVCPKLSRWWDIPNQQSLSIKSDSEYEAEFENLFEDAVALRMRADVPVGITLSGGLDSSAVVAAASSNTNNLKTFSVSFSNSPQTDELPYAREVAKEFSTDHHEVIIGEKEFMDFLPEFVWYTDEPLADLASIPLYYVSRLASQHVKVVLSGEGSDEVLAGYTFDQWALKWDESASARADLPWWSSGAVGQFTSRFSPSLASRLDKASISRDLRQLPEPITMTNYWTSVEKNNLLKMGNVWPDSLDSVRKQLNAFGAQHPLNQALYVYCQDWLVEDLLMKADRMSMANSIELRTPFLDYRLVEWAATIPPKLKAGRTANGEYRTKEILRRYAKSRLPQSIIDRPKQGFPVPVYGWLSGKLKPWAQEMLLSKDTQIANWIHSAALIEVFNKGTAEQADTKDRHRLWNLLLLEVWMKRWLN